MSLCRCSVIGNSKFSVTIPSVSVISTVGSLLPHSCSVKAVGYYLRNTE